MCVLGIRGSHRRVMPRVMPFCACPCTVCRQWRIVLYHLVAHTHVGTHTEVRSLVRTAIEIMPRGLGNHIYRDLSRTLGVYYQEVPAANAGGCGGGSPDARLACNVTVRVEAMVDAVARAAEWTAPK